ncbi:MAG: lipoyl(octanoyl) transferase LipB [Bacteroidales bacterium]|nr:lipoyl(octanoyl) transferase LipB [Bacteroidales bacterium]MDY6402527.1 lipoyl(octanoyl) transferase LipB [Bacteroidales bacterium]MDY6423572.1 lipoyl(octanoyl) transferase LipB [Bacteroidales bacterium]
MINFVDWKKIAYSEALDRQTNLFNSKVAQKLNGEENIGQDFILCEHNNVYTLGKHGKDSNLLVNDEFLKQINAEVYHINRGGDITYHGPGQITGYPSLDLDSMGLGIRDYIYTLEQMVINLMKDYDVECERLQGATGVWIEAHTKKARKICAIGVKVSRGITMHGFAFNVNTDLNYFSYINPCGFVDKGVTSMQKELHQAVDIERIKHELYNHFIKLV